MEKEGSARLLARGTMVLSAIGTAPTAPTFKEIQQQTNLAKATLSRILATLREVGFVRLEPSGRRYALGPHMLDLVARSQADLINRVTFKLETQRLADLLERPVWHWTLVGERINPLEQFLPFGIEPRGLDADEPVHPARMLHQSAAGTAVLAAMPPDRLASRVYQLSDYRDKKSDLSLRLGFSAATGFSIWDWDAGQGRFDIAAAVTDAIGAPVAALCVALQAGETTEAERHRIGRQLSYAAQKVSVGPNAGPRKRDVQTPVPQPSKALLQAEVRVLDRLQAPDKVGTSPYWDAKGSRVVWGDSLGGALNWEEPSGTLGRLDFAALPGAIVPYEGGRAVVASRDGLSIVDYQNDRRIALSHPEPDDTLRRFSVAKIGPDGRIWVGTLLPAAAEGMASGRLYAFGRDGKIEKVLNLERGAKGLGWSPDGSFMYLTEAGSQTILRFEMGETGSRPVNPRRFARHTGAGTPNGIAVDAEGCVWAAIYGGWKIARFDPSGQLIGNIELPVPLPTGLCFAGKNLQEIFVTNCRMHVPPDILDVARHAGKPLRISVNATGLPETEFRML